jgi:carboxyl-terminal processing protease
VKPSTVVSFLCRYTELSIHSDNALLKHVLLVALIIPASFAGYHVMAGSGANGDGFAPKAVRIGLGDFSLGDDYKLANLALLERDLYRLESRYVEKERLDPTAMFEGAMKRLQRQFPEVLTLQPEGSRNLHISVGSYSTVLRLGPITNFDGLYRQLSRVSTILDEHLSEEIERREVEYALVNGMLSTLDPHTILLPPAAARDMEVDNQGEFGGLGIEISMVEGELTVKVPLEDTPAFRVGLKPDDRIVRIEGESTINIDLEDAVSKLRGRVGDPVNIMVMRKGWSVPRQFTIIRERIRINPLEGELLEGYVGYIRIKSFNARAAQDLESNLETLHKAANGKMRGLVLDLRTNPGGFLNQAIDVADKFVSNGVIVATEEGATGERAEQRARRMGTEPDYPIVVIVNASSASASEIVAGAIRNLDRGVVIGERTFGKGSIQHLYPHRDDESRLKLTVGRYLTPGDKSIQAIGVTPDIRLIPSLVEPPEILESPDPWKLGALPQISLYWREWADREDSLDHSFKRVVRDIEKPVFEVRYRYQIDDEAVGRGIDPKTDWEVQFARDVVLAAPGSRRAEVLRGASQVISKYTRSQSAELETAFGAVGIDWSQGENPETPMLSASLDLGEDGVLSAGAHENVRLTVHNESDAPVYQISGVTRSENPWFDQREFYFGMIPAGESRSYEQRLGLHGGYPTTVFSVEIDLTDGFRTVLATDEVRVQTEGKPLPLLSYGLKLFDGLEGQGQGNGNGRPEVGERVVLQVSVRNAGEGPTRDAFVRLKNRSGRALDLSEGGFSVGEYVDLEGEPCEPFSPGCGPVLKPGEVHIGELEFSLSELPEAGAWDVDLLLGDNRAYDYSVIQQGGFFDFFQQEEALSLSPDQGLDGKLRMPPQIELTRKPEMVSQDGFAVISGIARSVGRARDIMVYHGEDKVFYEGGGADALVKPFTVERRLEPGPHSFYILVRDQAGLTSAKSVHIWVEDTG